MAKTKKRSKKKKPRRLILLKYRDEDGEVATFYTNGEYRYRDWKKDEYSWWKIVDGAFYYLHNEKELWDEGGEDDNDVLVKALEKAQLDMAFEKQVLK